MKLRLGLLIVLFIVCNFPLIQAGTLYDGLQYGYETGDYSAFEDYWTSTTTSAFGNYLMFLKIHGRS